MEPSWIACGSMARRSSNSLPSAPNTVRRMTLRVMRIIEGSVAKARSRWPRRELVDRFPFDDRLIGSQSPSVKRWRQHLAVGAMSITRQREQRIRTHHSAKIRIGRVGDLGAGSEQLPNMTRIAEDDDAPEDGQVEREGRPVAAAQNLQRDSAVGQRQQALNAPGEAGAGGQHDRRRRLVIGDVRLRQANACEMCGISHVPAMVFRRNVEPMHTRHRAVVESAAGRFLGRRFLLPGSGSRPTTPQLHATTRGRSSPATGRCRTPKRIGRSRSVPRV